MINTCNLSSESRRGKIKHHRTSESRKTCIGNSYVKCRQCFATQPWQKFCLSKKLSQYLLRAVFNLGESPIVLNYVKAIFLCCQTLKDKVNYKIRISDKPHKWTWVMKCRNLKGNHNSTFFFLEYFQTKMEYNRQASEL